LLLALAACGTTSNLQPSNPVATPASPHALAKTAALDLSGYDKVVVLDFTDATDKTKLKPEDARSYSDSMSTAVRTFADLIAQKIRSTGAFADVIRGGNADGKALVVSGRITRLVEGNGTLRFFIGFGAGSSYFEATTDVGDVESGQNLGHVVTDKNSWALGGGLAATQTVQSFMEGAATKIATQLKDDKKGIAATKTL
jgi:hypothetical protein